MTSNFISNTISIEQLSRAMRLGKLGEQVVLKSELSFEKKEFHEERYEFADSSVYFPMRNKRDSDAKQQYLTVERNSDILNGLFIRDIVGRR